MFGQWFYYVCVCQGVSHASVSTKEANSLEAPLTHVTVLLRTSWHICVLRPLRVPLLLACTNVLQPYALRVHVWSGHLFEIWPLKLVVVLSHTSAHWVMDTTDPYSATYHPTLYSRRSYRRHDASTQPRPTLNKQLIVRSSVSRLEHDTVFPERSTVVEIVVVGGGGGIRVVDVVIVVANGSDRSRNSSVSVVTVVCFLLAAWVHNGFLYAGQPTAHAVWYRADWLEFWVSLKTRSVLIRVFHGFSQSLKPNGWVLP